VCSVAGTVRRDSSQGGARGQDAVISAFHLPAIPHPPATIWSYGTGRETVELRVPQLDPPLLQSQVQALIDARERFLVDRPLESIIAVIDSVAARLADRDDPLRRTAERALPLVTGYSAPMISTVLDVMSADWRREPLTRLVETEFGALDALDGFTTDVRAGRRSRPFGPRLATHVFSGNVPGVGVTSLIRSLLVRAATLGKTAAGEPLLPALFAAAVDDADPELGACLAVTYWPGGNEQLEETALKASDAVVVYGGDDVIRAVRARTPLHARFLGYGNKVSFGMVGRDVLAGRRADSLVEDAARAVSLFDQQGCVSPHLFYVERGGAISPESWAQRLGHEMAEVERALPRGRVSQRESAAIRQLRGEAEFSALAGSGAALHASPDGTTWTVIHDPDPTFAASCLNRLVRVKPVDQLEEVGPLLRPVRGLLQTVGLAADEPRRTEIAAVLGRLGASRVVPLARMAWPPPAWHHDGRPPLRDLVRWCDIEDG
jgi:hypothetical protein